MNNEKVKAKLDDGKIMDMVAPEIISVSRRTDIPAFYADWFFHRLERGYVDVMNPFNPTQASHVSLSHVKFIVFWSKNPQPMEQYLPILDKMGIDWYLQYTLNNYPKYIEPNVPPLEERIMTFRRLARQYGSDRIVWRFDPLLYCDELGVDGLIRNIVTLYDSLMGLPKKLVISFADIKNYRKVQYNLADTSIRELDESEQDYICQQLTEQWRLNCQGLTIATCAESIDYSKYGIQKNACIDKNLIMQLSRHGDFARKISAAGKDGSQRSFCNCIAARDIGAYHTCAHGCKYCYANLTPDYAKQNYQRFEAGYREHGYAAIGMNLYV